jgi:hypothetical protein
MDQVQEVNQITDGVTIRPMVTEDRDAVETACAASEGNWELSEFQEMESHPRYCAVVEDANSPIAFVRFTKSLRVTCLWTNGSDRARNTLATKRGLEEAIALGRANGFTEIVVCAISEDQRQFLVTECGMQAEYGACVIGL